MKHNFVYRDGTRESVTVFHDGQQYVANTDHPNWNKIVDALTSYVTINTADITTEADWILAFFDLSNTVRDKFAAITDRRLSERVLVVGGSVLFDGMRVDNALTTAILGFVAEGLVDFEPLVLFFEKVEQNPLAHSREQLFRWLQQNKFSITQDGDIIAYKYVYRKSGRSDDDAQYVSGHAGRALVNGAWVDGKIPTSPGTVVEMPRNAVNHDPRQGCSTGLHAGTWSYVKGYGDVILRVLINPRDVVSVPTDSSEQKMRVCRYFVLTEVQSRDESTLFHVDVNALRTRVTDALARRAPSKKTVSKKAGTKKATAKKAAAKKAAAKKAPARKAVAKKAVAKKTGTKKATAPVKVAANTAPRYYDEFKKAHFETRNFPTLRWLAKEWELKLGSNPTKAILVEALAKEATRRRRSKTVAATVIR